MMRKLLEKIFNWLDRMLHEETYDYWENRCYRLEYRIEELQEEVNY